MVIVMEKTATEEHVEKVIGTLIEAGYDVHRSTGAERTILGAVGTIDRGLDPESIERLPGVREVVRISDPFQSG